MYNAICSIIVDILALLKGKNVSRKQKVRGIVYVVVLLGVAWFIWETSV